MKGSDLQLDRRAVFGLEVSKERRCFSHERQWIHTGKSTVVTPQQIVQHAAPAKCRATALAVSKAERPANLKSQHDRKAFQN